MEAILQNAIKQMELAMKPADSVSWRPNEPHAQAFYGFDGATETWKAATPSSTEGSGPKSEPGEKITRLALFSWNIDFMLPFAKSRMDAGLAELRTRVSALPKGTAAVIFLQECLEEDLGTIGEKQWVRDGFYRTDLDSENWASGHYGTTTLVDRRLAVTDVFRVHYYHTRMERDGLFVDVAFDGARNEEDGEGERKNKKVVRFCNTHLESLVPEPPVRPHQVELVAEFMNDGNVHGALMAGDFNAIQPFDRTLHSDNNLKDAYLELGGEEDSEEGYTWGQQAATDLREMYGCSRMDKVFYCGGLKVDRFERFGRDVLVPGERERKEILKLGFEKGWITDHLGVFVEVEVLD
ncbi:endonuclease/exonuclease/phosphatase family protein [Xylariaceae sp. AK1471]|nr:endonuclease/exonuclease/phosphatase family protein [Xylariaceae sp. AK1471]